MVENRPGAGGNIGTETVVNAPPDGHTLLLATLPNAVNATLYEKLNFNFIRDIAPVAGIIRVSMVILVHPSVPAKTVPELIAYAKRNPGKVNMASAGAGSVPRPMMLSQTLSSPTVSGSSSPSGKPSSNGVHAPLGGVVPTAGVIVPRKAPTSVTAYTVLGSLGSKTAPLM